MVIEKGDDITTNLLINPYFYRKPMTTIETSSQPLYVKEMNERFRQRQKIRSRNTKVLAENNPQKILELENPNRIEARRSIIPADEHVTLEGLIAGNDLMSVNYLPLGQIASKPVCRIEVRNEQGRTLEWGTGFMVSPNLLITNQHVLESKENCRKTLIQFNYEDDENFLPKNDVTFLLDPDLFFHNTTALDLALVAVKQKDIHNEIPITEFGYIQLIEKSGKALIGEYATLIHHPNKEKKTISIRENRLVDTYSDDPDSKVYHYLTDSLGGSSGSPVFNDQWKVFALHHGGKEKRDEQGRILALDNTVWEPHMGEEKKQYECNEGIRISKIIEYLRTINNSNTFQGKSKETLQTFLNLYTGG
jgi:endonuclease G, mitochondrial